MQSATQATTQAGSVLLERPRPGIAVLRLSNPGRMNSFTASMWKELVVHITALGAPDSGVRCIVVAGADAVAFAAGSDILEFRSDRANSAQARVYGKLVADGLQALEACEVPLVAMVRGACIGGGLAVASLCDIQVAGASSRFGVPVNKLGLVMAHIEMRGLVRRAGHAVVRELLLEGRILSAQDALDRRLVTRVVPDDKVEEEAHKSADAIARGAPLVARWHKRFIARLMDPAPLSEAEIDEANACFDTQDYRIGLDAFERKAAPKFTGA